jgi:hypothetical protein
MTSLRVIAALMSPLGIVQSMPASAQTTDGGIASATVSAMSIGDGTSASIAGAIGYRFNPVVALGIEYTVVPRLTPEIPEIPIPLGGYETVGISFPSPVGISFPSPAVTVEDDGGHATIFTTHLRLTIPTRFPRISPYLIGGAGVGTVTDKIEYTIAYPALTFIGPGGQQTIAPPRFLPRTTSVNRTTTDFTAALGGGVSFLAGGHWSFDVDARYMAIFGPRDAHIGRYGGGITYRF